MLYWTLIVFSSFSLFPVCSQSTSLVHNEVHLYLKMSSCQEIGAGKADKEREFNILF